ncbi:ABC transporter ATP-binding protein [Priestia taiwanensis]|uniref:ABC transporter ATP-binding protein n=1 Tax=Priestia taiwanensis TaxID=1347902 RepID=A0A917AW16_9BACI|nr:ABC transporter ATP-binding protein [Priestia taiwanensis]MBM7363486.1 ABC-2 type transport system ATP-binding protein [Priestia taiwanensis]GGE76762.1 ABC transporter ATP-binding protein [Priestia taiwanensis]
MGLCVQIENVSKQFASKQVLQNITLHIETGKIVGLLGNNGSGKTTICKMLAGLSRPTEGSVSIDGIPVGYQTKSIVSFMPDKATFEKWMKVEDIVTFFQDFYRDFNSEKAKAMLTFMKLDKQEKIVDLSKGMMERLQLTLALSRDAKLYVLDEPIGGVDPIAREKILDAIIEFYHEESTLLISTHLIKDIERIFDEVIFVKDGSIAIHENVEDIRFKRKVSVHDLFREVYGDC